jgi:AAA domain
LPSPGSGREWLKPLTVPMLPVPAWVPDASVGNDLPLGERREFVGDNPYGLAALGSAVRLIKEAQPPLQELTRHRECYSIGGLIAGGYLDYGPTLRALIEAALAMSTYDKTRPWKNLARLVEKSVARGMEKPRSIPEDQPPHVFTDEEVWAGIRSVDPEWADANLPPNLRSPSENEEPPPRDKKTPPPPPKPPVSFIIKYGEAPPQPEPWLAEKLLPEIGVGLIAGQWGVGKTFIGADLSASVMTGGEFAGRAINRRGGVLWFAAEGETEIEFRVRAVLEHKLGLSGDALARQPFARQRENVPVLSDAKALNSLLAHALKTAIWVKAEFDLPLSLIVLDTLAASARFNDENSAAEATAIFATLRDLSRRTKTLVVAIDHYGKLVETGVRGSSAKSDNADAILASTGKQQDELISDRKMRVEKVRRARVGDVTPFELTPISDESTCIVKWATTRIEKPRAPGMKGPQISAAQAFFMRVMDEGLAKHGRSVTLEKDNFQTKVIDKQILRKAFLASCDADEPKVKAKRWDRAILTATADGRVGVLSDEKETIIWRVLDRVPF